VPQGGGGDLGTAPYCTPAVWCCEPTPLWVSAPPPTPQKGGRGSWKNPSSLNPFSKTEFLARGPPQANAKNKRKKNSLLTPRGDRRKQSPPPTRGDKPGPPVNVPRKVDPPPGPKEKGGVKPLILTGGRKQTQRVLNNPVSPGRRRPPRTGPARKKWLANKKAR